MTINTGAAVYEYGTQTTVISDGSAITNTSFNAGTITPLAPTDVTPLADAVLDITLAVAPAAGKAVHLYRRDKNIDGTNHAPVPDANFKNTFVGSFPLDKVATRQFISLTDIPLTVDQEFYIENDSGQSTSGTTVLKVTPKSYNAKA
jgi:hypothetical protein